MDDGRTVRQGPLRPILRPNDVTMYEGTMDDPRRVNNHLLPPNPTALTFVTLLSARCGVQEPLHLATSMHPHLVDLTIASGK